MLFECFVFSCIGNGAINYNHRPTDGEVYLKQPPMVFESPTDDMYPVSDFSKPLKQ